jgi:lipoprotein-anchoring transpeptidase ErfK/SrfK
MNSLKTVFVLAILGAVAYGAYLSITHKPELAEPRDEAPAFAPGQGLPATAPGAVAAGHPGSPSGVQPNGAPMQNLAAPRVDFGTGMAAAPGPSAPGMNPASPPAALSAGTAPPPTATGPMPFPSSEPLPPAGAPPVQNVSYGEPLGRGKLPAPPDANAAAAPMSSPPNYMPQTPSADRYAPVLEVIQRQLDAGELKQAHLALTTLYNQPDLAPHQRSQITDLLDQLAGHVIYSREHLLEPPYRVQPGDTLEGIAQSHNIPVQLLANINGVADPLQPGTTLKVVRGPFNAVVQLDKHELTLVVEGRYAGRFPIGVGEDCSPLAGTRTFLVSNKTRNPHYYGPNNVQIGADDPRNPLGEFWIGLSEPTGAVTHIGIHGTNNPGSLHETGGPGSICLADRDIQDLFAILSIGPLPSKVTIVAPGASPQTTIARPEMPATLR